MSSSTAIRRLLPVDVSRADERSNAQLSSELLSDEAVMQCVQSGDKEALGILFDRYSRLVFSVAARILRDASEAEELVQDVFLYLYRKSANFDPSKSPLRSWLVQVTYCRALDRLDYLNVHRFYDCANIDEVVESVKSAVSLESLAQLAELRGILEGAFAALTQKQQQTLGLFFFEGYTLREISTRLDENLGNTRNHYYRGLEKLREALSPLAEALSPNGKVPIDREDPDAN